MEHRSTLIALWLWLACVVTAAGAGPPPQCDAEQPLINVTFLGPAQAVDAGGPAAATSNPERACR